MSILNNRPLCILLTIGLGMVLRTAALAVLKQDPGLDSIAYMDMAKTLMHTGQMDDGQGNLAFYSSGYPLFMIPFFWLFGEGVETARLLNLPLAGLSIWLVYLCGRKLLPSWRWALVPALVWAVYPPSVLYVEYVLKENLVIPLLLLQTLLLLGFREAQRKALRALGLGALFGFELLVGPAVILTGALIAMAVLGIEGLGWRPRRADIGRAFACALGCAVVVSPWLGYTATKLGTPVLNTNGSFNLYLGNNANATGMYISIHRTPMGQRWNEFRREKGEIEAFAALRRMALDYILDHPLRTVWMSLTKIAYFWTPPKHDGKYGNQSFLETVTRRVWLAEYLALVGFALVPLAMFRRLDRRHLMVYGTIVLYCAIYGVAFVQYRYRLTAMPYVAILAVSGLHYAWLAWRSLRPARRKATDHP